MLLTDCDGLLLLVGQGRGKCRTQPDDQREAQRKQATADKQQSGKVV